MSRKRTRIGPRRKTRSTAAATAIVAEDAAAVREKGAPTQAAKAVVSQQRNQLLIHFFLEDMEPSQLQRILLVAASTSFANLLDFNYIGRCQPGSLCICQ